MEDVIIIGGGAAGLSAAIFSCRRGLSTLLLTKEVGGQTASTSEIENYPGVGRVEGPQLIDQFFTEAIAYGTKILYGEVEKIEQIESGFSVYVNGEVYQSHAVICAFGKTPRDMGIESERQYRGKGVSYTFITDAKNCEGKTVAVIGGGNSALEAALRLDTVASKVYLIHRRAGFRGEQILLDRLGRANAIVTLTPYHVSEIQGDDRVETLLLTHMETNEQMAISVDGVFPCLGFEPKTGFLGDLISLDEEKRVIVGIDGSTSVPGVFAAGDCTTVPYQQIVISAGDGAKAALSAYHFVQKKLGKRALRVDWGFSK
ncbi:MAG: FAD-dependent oxidoreductase [bacterium]|nr:FAD-dependent oxidoreductase [bacterium]